MEPSELVSLIISFTVILIVSVVVAASLAWLRAQKVINALEKEKTTLNRKLDALIVNQIHTLSASHSDEFISEASRVLKEQIDQELQNLAQIMNVKSVSVLVPFPASEYTKFCFLSVLGEDANNLRYTLIDIDKGFAGVVFKKGHPLVSNQVEHDSRWYRNVDGRIPFRAKTLLSLPLTHKNKTIGVIQFLNKPEGFNEDDITTAIEHMTSLNHNVKQFVADTTNFNVLGIARSQFVDEATILVAELSNLPSLLKEGRYLAETDIINLINEYFDSLTLIGLSYGGVVDKFSWGGFIMNFNVSKDVNNHRVMAVRAAFEMNIQFNEFKKSWQQYGFPVNQIFNRIAVASGTILEVTIEPNLNKQRTVIGDPIVIASTLSALAPRDRNVVTVDPSVHQDLSSLNIKSDKVQPEEIGKVRGLIQEAYRIRLQNVVA